MIGKTNWIGKAVSLFIVVASLVGASPSAAQAGDWTWVDGSSTIGTTCYSNSYPCGQLGVYGTKGVFAPASLPGSRTDAMSWTDTTGRKWLFGGFGYGAAAGGLGDQNDLWQSNAAGTSWEWVSGSSGPGHAGTYGTKGTAAAANVPGGRQDSVTWTDSVGNLWLFGGLGYDGSGTSTGYGYQNDLWMYNPTTNQWTWEGGSSTVPPYTTNSQLGTTTFNSSAGTYGTLGMPAASNTPAGRTNAMAWTDASGNLWMFGGGYSNFDGIFTNYTLYNDLWEFNTSTKQWTWQGGSNTSNGSGVYGTLGTAASSNIPGARYQGGSWKDPSGNFWLFGGYGYDVNGAAAGLDDLWEFNPNTQQWTWESGAKNVNTCGNFLFGFYACDQAGNYGTQGTAGGANLPGGRTLFVTWTDTSGNLWLFGGSGADSVNNEGWLNDLWKFSPTTPNSVTSTNGEWTWVGGNSTRPTCTASTSGGSCGAPGVYGTLGTAASANMPGARQAAVSWTDQSGNFWLFGGWGEDSASTTGYLNDMWQYQPGVSSTPTAATPTFSVAAGTYSSAQTVTLSDSTSGATIYYTTNGTTPTAGSSVYGGAITVSSTETVEAIAVASGYSNSAVATAAYTITTQAAAPTFSVAGGSYSSAQTVTLSDSTTGATIYYTTNGTTPTTSSSVYGGAVTVSSTETLEAIAVASGYTNSAVATASYTITQSIAATPTFSVAGGSYSSAQTVTLSDSTSGATIYYTTNGTTPTASSSVYRGAINVSATETLEAIAVATGYSNSTVATAAYTITQPTAATPTFSVAGGTYSTAQTVTLSDSTSGATIYYTTNGTTPTTSSSLYSTAINVSASETLEAIAVGTGYTNSAVATAAYTIVQPIAATPTFSVIGGSYSSAQTVTLSDSTSGAIIYYTTNGTTPTTSSSLYSTAINVSATETLEAIAVATGYTNSAVATAAYTIVQPTAATPTFSVIGGSYSSAQTVTLSDSTSGAIIYYTTNGTTPTTSSSLYSTAINVSATETLEAIAVATGYTNSAVATAAYTIVQPIAATPTFSVAGGSYGSAQTVTLSDTTAGATIYYTTNGTTPTISSTVYSGAVNVSATETLEAIAVATGYTNSPVATATYTITILLPSFTITSPAPVQSVTAGSAATYTISVTPQNGAFTSPITFSVNGLPSGATATFNPATVTPGSTATSTTLTITTPAMALLRGMFGLPSATRPITLAVLILLFLPGKQHRRKIWLALMLMVSFGAATILTGCGGGFESPASGSATYNITLTAAGGSVQQVTTLQLTVKE